MTWFVCVAAISFSGCLVGKAGSRVSEPRFDILGLNDNPSRPVKIPQSVYRSTRGSGEDALISNCVSAYRAYWKDANSQTREHMPFSPRAISGDVKIIRIEGRIAVVERTDTMMSPVDFSRIQDIWIFKGDTWIPFGKMQSGTHRAVLTDLNDDGLMDAVAVGGCCDSVTYNVLLGCGDDVLRYVQDISVIGQIREQFNGTEKRIIVEPFDSMKDESDPASVVFNKKKNRFVRE